MKSPEEIHSQYLYRRTRLSHKHQEMTNIAKCYTGGIQVALPELAESERPAVANVLRLGIRGLSQRVASVTPMVVAPAVRPGFKNSEGLADQRRQAVVGWRTMNNDTRKRRRRSLYLVAMGQSPVSISPVPEDHDERKIPFVKTRNPLCTFPADMHDMDNIEPDDCIFLDTRPRSWLEEHYPAAMRGLRKGSAQSFDVLEYVDAYETTFVVLGSHTEAPSRGWGLGQAQDGGAPQMLLTSVPNRTNLCPVVVPGQIDLEGCVSQFAGLIGMYEKAAKLDALLMIATVRDVFQESWVESLPQTGQTPTIVEEADGLMGVTGIIKSGHIQWKPLSQNQAAGMALDSLERSQRLDGGVPAEWGGESPSNVRTARRGADVLSSATDMPIQEYQEVLEASYDAEHRRMIAVMKTYYGRRPTMFLIPHDGKVTRTDYTPNEAFETDQVFTRYPLPGQDFASMTVQIGQMIGDGTLSAETGMELDPRIEDVPNERRRIYLEGLRRALLQGLESQAGSGQMDPHKIALIALELAKPNVTLEEAVDSADKKLQAAQSQTEQGQPTDDGQQPTEAAQPGLDQSPEAAALAKQTAIGQTSGIAGQATVPPPNAGGADLMKMLAAAHPPAAMANA